MKIAVVIVAAGSGTRLGGPVPKQYQHVGGEMILTRTLRAFLACSQVDCVQPVINPDLRDLYDEATGMLADERLLPAVPGGTSRAQSVLLGLEALTGSGITRVLIHDAARPFVPQASVEQLCAMTEAAMLAEPVADALWREDDGLAQEPVPRAGLWRAQTPQAFDFEAILKAHRDDLHASEPALDDAETYRRAGGTVRLVPGSPDNFKITRAADIERAERYLNGGRDVEVRVGQGFDVHRFKEGDHVWLCGVSLPHTASLDGHSDADVGIHSLADAIYGALAEGDIGTHFPPSDPKWRGAESHVFLTHAATLVRKHEGRIVNVDLTLLCEAPKIKPHAQEMRDRLSEILDITGDRISIKATTMERMGFVGREEGMGCIANVTIEVPRR